MVIDEQEETSKLSSNTKTIGMLFIHNPLLFLNHSITIFSINDTQGVYFLNKVELHYHA
ncbi:hypothetical protein CPS_4981 [Colwellia psychrerythraea 34H]|uniref:Uncharacterized protein n=1 Tax=Colwellia psychrerythraea (strain 34H / ATCC BAA-681) TaxID=167879 RepID=Q47UA3_COLP3|nr:hypothetical protein CPS_4981 [Colwellia psychrerythraea 34H]